MFFRIFTAKESFWATSVKGDVTPDDPDCLNLKNCEITTFDL